MKNIFYLMITIGVLGSVIMAKNGDNLVQVKINNGLIEGYQDSTDLSIFLGIPFAKPPVGDLRWKAPQPIENWDGVLKTQKFGPTPAQIPVWGDMHFRADAMMEDCLYLNVWTPVKETSGQLPVLVYFYGGGFVAGCGSEARYDGASMARKGMVTLTVNYRLNIFGFFAHPELSTESPYHASGNYGLLDQNLALKWVKKNIAAFGGDPDRVTIAGESAGSISVSGQMASPLSKDLIAGAIGESGAAVYPTLAPVSLKEAEKQGEEFARNAGYPTIKELRALSTDELLKLYADSKRFGFPSCIDGYFYPKSIVEIFKAGEQAQVPLLLGWNSAEIPGFSFTQGPYTEENYVNKVKEAYPDEYEQILKLYPHSSEKEIELSATALASDRFIAYSTWKWFDLHRKNSSQPVFRYLYSKLRPPLADEEITSGLAGGTQKKVNTPFKMPEPIGAPHACEIEYCMGNLTLVKDYAWTAEDFKVSDTMQNYFANFIKTGNPSEDDLPEWPAAEANDDTPPVMIINVESKIVETQHEDRYKFLDKAYENE